MVIGRLLRFYPWSHRRRRLASLYLAQGVKDEETARLFAHEMAARNDEVTKRNF